MRELALTEIENVSGGFGDAEGLPINDSGLPDWLINLDPYNPYNNDYTSDLLSPNSGMNALFAMSEYNFVQGACNHEAGFIDPGLTLDGSAQNIFTAYAGAIGLGVGGNVGAGVGIVVGELGDDGLNYYIGAAHGGAAAEVAQAICDGTVSDLIE